MNALWKMDAGKDPPLHPWPPVVTPSLQAIFRAAEDAAQAARHLSVLILGEAGVGKTTLACWLHQHAPSPRADSPIARVRCDALPESLADMIFGRSDPGLLEEAKNGTVLLQHVDALPLPIQGMLMRVVEQRRVWRVGGLLGRSFDAHFVSTSRGSLDVLVADGTFRGDLFPRLSPITITIPPLRERPEDIEPLARHFLRQVDLARIGSRVTRLSEDAVALLRTCHWPGNVRHLYRELWRALPHCEGEVRPEHFDAVGLKTDLPDAQSDAPAALSSEELLALPPKVLAERESIAEALAIGSTNRAAETLGIPRHVLLEKIRRYRIPRPT